jgi:hypothetical protein
MLNRMEILPPHLFLDLLLFIHRLDLDRLSQLFNRLRLDVESEFFPHGETPLEQGLEIPPAENLEVFRASLDLFICLFRREQPFSKSAKRILCANCIVGPTHCFPSSPLKLNLLARPKTLSGSTVLMNSMAGTSVKRV